MLLKRDKSQLLIIDMQEKLLPAVAGADAVAKACTRLIEAAKTLGVPVTFSQQYPRGLGNTVDPVRNAAGNDAAMLDKVEFSCMRNTALRDRVNHLRREGRTQVVVGGIEAHVCVAQTAIELEEHGMEAFVAADATSSRKEESRALALTRLAKCGVDIVDSEMVIFEWLGSSAAPEFKQLQGLLK